VGSDPHSRNSKAGSVQLENMKLLHVTPACPTDERFPEIAEFFTLGPPEINERVKTYPHHAVAVPKHRGLK